MIDSPDKLDKWMKKHKVTRAKLPTIIIDPWFNEPLYCERTYYRILKGEPVKYDKWLAIDYFLGKYK